MGYAGNNCRSVTDYLVIISGYVSRGSMTEYLDMVSPQLSGCPEDGCQGASPTGKTFALIFSIQDSLRVESLNPAQNFRVELIGYVLWIKVRQIGAGYQESRPLRQSLGQSPG